MKYCKRFSFFAAGMLLAILLASCDSVPAMAQVSETPAETPVPTQTVPPPPSIPSTPTPTPAPRRFAEKFSDTETVSFKKFPFKYSDNDLCIEVSRVYGYFMAEIWMSEGNIPYSGFAHKSPPGNRTQAPSKMAQEYGAVLAITGDFISRKGNPKGAMIREGIPMYDENRGDTMAIMPDGELRGYYKGTVKTQELMDLDVQDSYTFGPIIIYNGKVNELIKKHPLRPDNLRTAIGMVEPGHYIVIIATLKITLDKLADILLKKDVSFAYNLDGGHSSALVFMGKQLNSHRFIEDWGYGQRNLPDMLMFGYSDTVLDMNEGK